MPALPPPLRAPAGYNEPAVRSGLENAVWPARLQRLTSGPVVAAAGEAEVWLDGGHNLSAAESLASSLGEMEAGRERPLVLICAFSKNKDATGFLAYFEGLAARVIAIDFQGGA
jgi:dihydrofolate synthase/folylpolyglutamate synthase